MKFLWLSIYLVLWALLARCVLYIGTWDLREYQHWVCGPWGCGPAPSALLAAHGFWVINFMAGITLLAITAKPEYLERVGMLFTFGGLCGLLALGACDFSNWLPQVSGVTNKYLVQRYFYTLVTSVEFPVGEMALAGLAALALGKCRERRRVHQESNTIQCVEARPPKC